MQVLWVIGKIFVYILGELGSYQRVLREEGRDVIYILQERWFLC